MCDIEDECVHCGQPEEECKCRDFVNLEDEDNWRDYTEFLDNYSAFNWIGEDF